MNEFQGGFTTLHHESIYIYIHIQSYSKVKKFVVITSVSANKAGKTIQTTLGPSPFHHLRASATPSKLADDGVGTGEAAFGDADEFFMRINPCYIGCLFTKIYIHIKAYTHISTSIDTIHSSEGDFTLRGVVVVYKSAPMQIYLEYIYICKACRTARLKCFTT